jgi:hypothetical protein
MRYTEALKAEGLLDFSGAVDAGFGEWWAEAVSQMTSKDGR